MARTFDGVDDQIAFGSEAAIDDMSGFTACLYVRITAAVTDERIGVSKFSSGYVGKQHMAFLGSGGSNNKVSVYMNATGSDPYAESVADVLAVDTWKCIITTWAGTVGGTAPQIFACTVGGLIAEVSYASQVIGSGTIESDAGATLRVGARDALDATFFTGGLAESALWNRVLTADEMIALGRGFSPAFFSRGRVMYCPIDGRTSPERNLVGGGSNGTVTGTTFLDHPSIIRPVNYNIVKGTPAAPSVGQPYVKRLAGVPWMTPTRFSGVW